MSEVIKLRTIHNFNLNNLKLSHKGISNEDYKFTVCDNSEGKNN